MITPNDLQPLPSPQNLHILTEQVTDGTLSTAPLPPGPDRNGDGGVSLHAGATEEYVSSPISGGSYSSAMSFAQSLPAYIDDVSADFGEDIYERMALDSHIAGEVNNYKLAVLAGGVRLLPAFDDSRIDVEQQRKHKIACAVRAFCQSALDELDTPLVEVLDDMLSAFYLGNRVGEVVYRKDGNYLMLNRLAVKHRQSYAFVTDSRGKLLGLLAALAGRAETQVIRPNIVVDPAKTPNLLPCSKFMRVSWRPRLGDPRGTSVLRPAYNPWWQKRQTEIELARYIAQFAGSGLVITMGENAKPTFRRNADGSVAKDENDSPIMDHPQDLLLANAQQYKNGSVLILPAGSTADNVVTNGAGAPFFEQIKRCDREMSKAILGQNLATNEGEHQARAASSGQKDVMDVLIQHGEDVLCAAIRRVLKNLVLLNYGPDWVPYVPIVSLSAAEEADIASLSTAYSGLGYTIAPEHFAEIDAKLGLAPRSEEATAVKKPGDDTTSDTKDEEDPKKKASFNRTRSLK